MMSALPVRLPEELATQLREASQGEGRSMNAVVVTAISEYLERKRSDRVLTVAESVMKRHAELLDRLADS
jgi:predicted transcriptional regulator